MKYLEPALSIYEVIVEAGYFDSDPKQLPDFGTEDDELTTF